MKSLLGILGVLALLAAAVPATTATSATVVIHLKITAYSDPGLTTRTSHVQEGGSLYLVVSLLDQHGKPYVWASTPDLLITLSAGKGVLSATDVFILMGSSNTYSSFGLVLYEAPSSCGPVHIDATAVVSGVIMTAEKLVFVTQSVGTR